MDQMNDQTSPDRVKDARVTYMKRCLENLDRTLPIFDKIYNKTLCLENYLITDGHCKGLGEACEFLDSKLINRMVFNNCGMNGDQLATILEGVAKMIDFKALTYNKNTMSLGAIERLHPIFERSLPHHFEELCLIDCKMTPSLIESLMDALQLKQRVRKFALVKA